MDPSVETRNLIRLPTLGRLARRYQFLIRALWEAYWAERFTSRAATMEHTATRLKNLIPRSILGSFARICLPVIRLTALWCWRANYTRWAETRLTQRSMKNTIPA